MLDFLVFQRRSFYLIPIWLLVGYFSINAAVLFIAASFIILFLKRLELEMLLGLFLMMILSDNYYLHYPGTVKPILLVLLSFYVFSKASIRAGAPLIITFIPFFIYTICLLPLSDYLTTAIQKNVSYILLFASIPPMFYHLYKEYGNELIRFVIYFFLILGLANFAYRFFDPYLAHSHGGRLRALFGNPNGLAMFCFFGIVFFETARNFFKIKFDRSTLLLYYGVFFTLLILTSSRASIFSVLIFYSFLFIARFSLILAVFSMLVLFGVSQFLIDPLIQFLIDIGLGETFRLTTEGAQSLESGSGRLVAWTFAWEQIQQNFFIGKAWAHEEELFHTPSIQHHLNLLNHQGGAHNVYLIFWMNTGLLGLLLFFIPYIRLFYKASLNSELAFPLLAGSSFLAFFEPWLAGSLNPYTIVLLMLLTSFLFIRPLPEEDAESE